ncbi:MAG: hypothetical protein RL757_1750 [Bacteroidota bacterium]|jgi:pyridoxine 5-phosphate synthase
MTRLSVNINKIAVLRNSRGGNMPDLFKVAADCERFGAEGITVHPRPDERHIRHADIAPLKKLVTTEFNIEGYPDRRFLDLVLQNKPHQATLVPDDPNQLTSDHGWNIEKDGNWLQEILAELKAANIRTSLFVDPDPKAVQLAHQIGADRIEIYTGIFAKEFETNPQRAIEPHIEAATMADKLGIGINAGHDLNLDNLRFYRQHLPTLLEVSIGHALVSDALYFGLHNTIQLYLRQLK